MKRELQQRLRKLEETGEKFGRNSEEDTIPPPPTDHELNIFYEVMDRSSTLGIDADQWIEQHKTLWGLPDKEMMPYIDQHLPIQ